MIAGIDASGRNINAWNHIRAVLLLPAMNTIFIPATLLWLFRDSVLELQASAETVLAVLFALPFLGLGITLAVRAVLLFIRRGRGTLAPWDPTEVLITEDIYRYSRNPMKAGLFLILIGECLLLRSPVLTLWTVSFIAVNAAYIRGFEEKGLLARFGEDYAAYCRSVPRWLRLTPHRSVTGHCRESHS